MSKESKHRREDRKKPAHTLKEKRALKHEKRQHQHEHRIDDTRGPADQNQ